VTEPIAVLLLPSAVEELEPGVDVRDLLSIPRVIALEPSRFATPRLLRDAVPVRQAKRLRLPGEPRLIVLYHPGQYLLARALCGRYPEAELWYARPDPAALSREAERARVDLSELDRLARERVSPSRIIDRDGELGDRGGPLRRRLRELEIISPRPFVPWARIDRR